MTFPCMHIIVFCLYSTYQHPPLSLLHMNPSSPQTAPLLHSCDFINLFLSGSLMSQGFYYILGITQIRASYSNVVMCICLCMMYAVYICMHAYVCTYVCIARYKVHAGQRLMSRVFLVTLHLHLLKQYLSWTWYSLPGCPVSTRDPHLSLLLSAGITILYNYA